MRATAADIARFAAGNESRGVNAKAFGPPPAVSPDLALILTAVEQAGYGPAELEYPVIEGRKWRFDCAWPQFLCAVERHGGKFVTTACTCGKRYTRFVSRHHDKDGLENDAEKMNAATSQGWAVIVATPPMLTDGRALVAVLATLARRAG